MAAGGQKPINYIYLGLDEESETLTQVIKIRGSWKKKKKIYQKPKNKSHRKKKFIVKETQKDKSLPQKAKREIQRSARNGRWSGSYLSVTGLLFLLILVCACGVSLAQDYKPTITVIRYPAQVGDRVVVECDVGTNCIRCHMNWFVNGVIISPSDENYGAEFISGIGHLVFRAMAIHRNSEIFCILGAPSPDSVTLQNYSSDSVTIQFGGLITTPVYLSTPSSDNSIPTTDETTSPFDTSNKTRTPDFESSGSGLNYTKGMEQLDMDVPVNTSNWWTTERIAAVSLGVGILVITSIGVGIGVLVYFCKKRSSKVTKQIRESEDLRVSKFEQQNTDLPTAQETTPAPETNDSTDNNDKFPEAEQQTAGTLADLAADQKAAFVLLASKRHRAVHRHHEHSQVPDTTLALDTVTTVHEVKSSYIGYTKPHSAEMKTDVPTAQTTTPLPPGAPMMVMPTLELGSDSQQNEMSQYHSEISTGIRNFLSSTESSYNTVPIDQHNE